MASANGGSINFNVNMNVNKNGLNQILKPLQQIQSQVNSMSTDKLTTEFQQAANSAKQLESIINSSWNQKLGQLNLDKFNQSIKNSYGSMTQLKNSLTGAGTMGSAAFSSVATSILNTNVQLRESNKLLDSMATSMANTVKWGITSGIFNSITSSIRQAYYYTKDLDTSLNNIRIVTGDSADQMQRFANTANNAAKNLGRSTLDYTKAALSFYQQGLGEEQVTARTETTLKAQNITGAGSEMADYLTAVWNGFDVKSAEQTEEYVDKLAKVADSSASNMSQLAIAMSKVASIASVMGVDVDQLTAQLATVIATTRQAPESVGTAFKTIYSRLNDIKAGADDAQISLGNYSGKMAELGFNVLDATGHLRDTGQVIEQIGSRWQDLSKQQQISLAQIMGGMRQVNQITALFENWGKYSDLLNQSLSAQGTLNQKNDIYLESTAAHMKQLQAQTERTYAILLNQDAVRGFSDVFTGALKQFNDFIAGIGGGTNAFVHFGSIVANIFNKQIAQGIVGVEQSIQRLQANLGSFQAKQNIIQDIKNGIAAGYAGQGISLGENALNAQAQAAEKVLAVQRGLTAQQQKQAVEIQRQIGLTQQKIDDLEKQQQAARDIVQTLQQEEIIKGRSVGALKQELDSLKTSSQLHSQNLIAIENVERALNRQHALGLSMNQTESQRLSLAESLDNSYSEMETLWERQGKNIQEFSQRFSNVINGLRTGNTETRQFKTSWEAIKTTLSTLAKQQQTDLTKIDTYLKNIGIDTTHLTQQQKERLELYIQQNNALAKQGQLSLGLQKTIRVINGLTQGLTAIIGGISTATDQTATAAERANGAWSAFSGGITGGLMIINPMLGLAATGILNLGKTILEVTGRWDKLEERYKTSKDKIEELNTAIKETNKINQDKTSQIANLEAVKDEYAALSEKAGQYGVNINRLTDDEKTRYHELTNEFSQYNQAVIVGYDQQGNAIVRGQQALSTTIELLKTAKKQAMAASLGGNLDAVTKGINARHERKDYSTELEGAKNRVTVAKNAYDAAKAELQEHTKLDVDSLQLTYEVIQERLDQYGINVSRAFDTALNQTGTDFRGTIIPQVGKTIGQILDDYQNAVSDSFQLGKDGWLQLTSEEDFENLLSLGQILQNYVNNSLTALIDPEAINISQFTALLHNYNASILDQLQAAIDEAETAYNEVKQASEEAANQLVNYTQEDANVLILAMQSFDSIGAQYQSLQQKVSDLQMDPTFLFSLMSNFITSISDETSVEDLITQARAFSMNVETALTQTYNVIAEAAPTAIENIKKFSGAGVGKYRQVFIQQIQNLVSQFDMSKLQDESVRNALADIIKQQLQLSPELDIKITPKGKVKVDKTQLSEQIRNQLQSAFDMLNEKMGQLGVENLNAELGSDELLQVFNIDEIEHFGQTLDQIDWGTFLLNLTDSRSALSALKLGFEAGKEGAQELNEETAKLNFDTVFDQDALIKRLQGNKDLTDQQRLYLDLLMKEDSKLAEIAQHESLNSDNFIKRLKQRESLGQQLYVNELKREKNRLENSIAAQTALNEKIDQSSQAYAERQLKIAQLKRDLIQVNYDLVRSQQVLADKAKQQAEAEKQQALARQEAALKRAQEKGQVISRGKSGLESLKQGKALTADQATALVYLERADQNLRNIAEEKGRYSAEYTQELEKQLELQKNIAEQAKNQQLAILEAQKARQQQERAELSKGLVTQEQAAAAHTTIAQSKKPAKMGTQQYSKVRTADDTGEAVQNAQQILDLYGQQADQRQQLAQKDQQILETQGQILQIQSENNDEAVTKIETLTERVNAFRQIVNTLGQGKNLSDDQFTELTNTIDFITSNYPELTAEAELLKQTWLSGTDAYKQALNEVEGVLEDLSYQEIFEQTEQGLESLKSALEKISIGIDTEQYDTWMEDIQDWLDSEKELHIAIDTDMDEEVQRLSNQMQTIYDAASKIGENFIVAAGDLQELSSVFPGILDGMQLLDNGSFQLSSNMVQRAISVAQAEIGAESESVNQRLDKQADLLQAKADTYHQMATACRVLAGEEVDSQMTASEARAVLSDGLAEIQGLNSELTAQQQMDNQTQVADNSNKNAGIVASNWSSAAFSLAQSFAQAARSVIENAHQMGLAVSAAAKGEQAGSAVGAGGVINSYRGNSGSKGTANVFESIKHTLEGAAQGSKQKLSAAADAMDAAGDAYDKAAADARAQKEKNEADLSKFMQGLDNVAGGGGINGGSGSGGGGRGGGGGKGGGSGSEKEPDVMQPLKEQLDRYHDIDLQLKKIEDDLSKIENEQDKLFGKDLINNLNKQIQILKTQEDAYERKIKLAKEERDQIQKGLKDQGVLFDSNTFAISNYAQIMGKKLDQVNAIIAHYNTLSAEQQKEYKKTVEKAKKDYEEFKKTLQNYDKIVSETIPDLEKQVTDARDKIIEKQIQKFKIKVEIELDLSQAKRDWNKFRKQVIERIYDGNIVQNARSSLKDFYSYYGKQSGLSDTGLVSTLTSQINNTIDQIKQINSGGTSSKYGNNKAQALEDLKTYTDELMKSLTNVEELFKQVEQSFFDMVDATDQAFGEQVKQYEFLGELIQHDKKLIELLYGEESYKQLNAYHQMQKENDRDELEFRKLQRDFWWEQMELSKFRMSQLQEGSNEYEQQKKRFEELKHMWMDSIEDLNDKIEDAIDHLLESYKNHIGDIFKDLEQELTGAFGGLDYVSEEWELINKQADMYLDKVNSMSQIQNFENAVKQAMNDNKDNVNAQQSLNKLMQTQLQYLRGKDKLTKYDVDRANMLLQIELKRLALQNARQSKSQLRLRRDSQGNYSYQYVADQDKINQAESALRSAQTDLYNLDKDEYKNNLDSILQEQQNFNKELKALYEQYPTWTEQAEQKRKLLIEKYNNIINGLVKQNNNIRVNLAQSASETLSDLYDKEGKSFKDMTQAEKDALLNDLVPYGSSRVQAMADKFAANGGLTTTYQPTLEKLTENAKQYNAELEVLQQLADTSFTQLKLGEDDNIDRAKTLLSVNSDLVAEYGKEFIAIGNVIEQVTLLRNAYKAAADEAIKAAKASNKLWTKEQEKAMQAADKDNENSNENTQKLGTSQPKKKKATDTKKTDKKDTTKKNETKKSKTATEQQVAGIAAAIWLDDDSEWGNNPERRNKIIEKFDAATATMVQDYINKHALNGDIQDKWAGKENELKKYRYSSFKTGGYTGDWGKGGRIGVLHEKEIVLNQQDTSNILSAVNIVRSIDDLLNNLTANTQIPNILSTLVPSSGFDSNLNQNVTITASFPAVNSRVEIESAFNNLINRASQYAYNTQR